MPKIITAAQAAKLIPDGATIAIGCMGLAGWAEEIARAIAARYKETGHPSGINLKQGCATGDWGERGTTVLGIEGLVTKWTGAHIGSAANLIKLTLENKIETHCLPQGVIVNLWREIAAGRPGLLTKIGMGTFVDPQIEGGKMNEITKDDLVERVNFQGEDWLLYKSFPVDVALLRATHIDEAGNMTLNHDGLVLEALAIAEATRNTGGKVIVQAEYLVKTGSLNPREVIVPGALVDYIVLATDKDACWQTEVLYYEPSFSGQNRIPVESLSPIPLNDKKVIARRSAMEIRRGNIANLGFGMPSNVGSVAAEEDVSERFILTTEGGVFGGVPASGRNFGQSYNPEAMISHNAMFDFYDGGGLDVTVLGLAQADEAGNINVSKFANRPTGPGGFINISQTAKTVVFCGNFTAGSKVTVENGKIVILKEGKNKKFVKQVEQITFSGAYATETKQNVFYVTERAVFKLIDGKVTLIEVAPGVDLEKDILEQMEFTPVISPKLKEMDPAIFQENWGGLKAIIG